jgi:hypothetical protein
MQQIYETRKPLKINDVILFQMLKLAGLVCDRHAGRETHYSVKPQGLLPLIDWMGQYGAFWRDRFDKLENLLNRMDQ